MQRRLPTALVYGAVILAVVVLAAATIFLIRWQAYAREKQDFIDWHEAEMTDCVRRYYCAFDQLPASTRELLAYDTSTLRSPDVWTQLVNYGLFQPPAGYEISPFEHESFDKALEASEALIPQWRAEIELARKPLRDRDGDLSAQLDLWIDPEFERLAGTKFLLDLGEGHKVGDETVLAFIQAANDYLIARRAYDPSLGEMEREHLEPLKIEFEQNKQEILEAVAEEELPPGT